MSANIPEAEDMFDDDENEEEELARDQFLDSRKVTLIHHDYINLYIYIIRYVKISIYINRYHKLC